MCDKSESIRSPLFRRVVFGATALTMAFIVSCSGASDEAEPQGFPAGAPVADVDGNSLGSIAFATSCSTEANEEMRRGLALLHHMTYTQAEAAFQRASEADPDCALSYWGVALTYLHPLWPDVPPDEALKAASELLAKAREVGTSDPREAAYIGALESYYRDGLQRPESERLASYVEAWAEVAAIYPSDPEAALFKALSLMSTASDADKTHAQRAQAGAVAEGVLRAIPDHPGAHHYVIHAYDVPPLADQALSVARSYGALAPDNAHALHMTSHIFTRIGLWEESIEFNERSAAAALRSPIKGAVSHHHLHALDYLAYAHLQRGDQQSAVQVLEHLHTLTGPVVDHAVSAYAFAAVPVRIALESGRWAEAATAPVRWPGTISWDAFPQYEAIGQFARAMGSARTGDRETAQAALARLAVLRGNAEELPGTYDWATQVEIQEMAAQAWLAFEGGDSEGALRLMTEAADLESTTEKSPVTPGEVLPARELLADMLMELGRPAEALTAFEAASERSPNRLKTLYGAGYAAEQSGDLELAREYYTKLIKQMVDGAAQLPQVVHAQQFLAGQ